MGSNYHGLANIIGTYPQLAIFRRFLAANARSLLIMQAEIANISSRLGEVILEDRNHTNARRKELEKEVWKLQTFEENYEEADQWRKIKELRKLLQEYNTALLQFQTLCRLPPANKTNSKALRDWLLDDLGGEKFLRGAEGSLWDFEQDLTSLMEVDENKDVISKWIDGPFISWFYRRIGRRFKGHTLPLQDQFQADGPTTVHLDYYPESTTVVTIISTVFASTLPTLSIFALYYITTPVVRLGMITVFTSMFSLIVAVFANAKRADCFAATAAFAAVLVVFVGSTTDSNSMVSSG